MKKTIFKMKKQTIIIVSILAVFAIGVLVYKPKNKKGGTDSGITKDQAVNYIFDAKKHASKEFLNTMETDFLIAWANGISETQSKFSYKGNNYYTQGGKRIV